MCISYNNMNNNWMNLFQQGLRMLGINNTVGSFGSFSPMSMNGSLFNYNVNYDAMAFFTATNAVLGVGGQAYSTSRAEKQAEKQEYANNQTRLEQIEKEISDLKKTDITKEVDTRSKTDSKVKSKQTAFETASSNLQNAVDYINNNKSAYDAAKAKDGKELTSDEKQLIIDYKAKKDKDKPKLEQAKTNAENELNVAKRALETKIKNEIQDKINDLKAEKEKLQKEVESYEDSKVNIKLASSDEVYNAKIKDIENKYDDKNDDGSFTKKDVYSAIKRFINAADGSPEKLKVAKELSYAHNHCGNDFDAQTIRYAQRAFNYINEYKEEA